MAKTILTGIKPTGHPHIGNLFGMILPTVKLCAENEESFVFIANIHALNSVKSANDLREQTYEVAGSLFAFGLDTAKTVFYRQSDVPEIFELTSILMNYTPKGLMNRAHAYKAVLDKDGNDDNVNMGLYTYPILMAADILAMDSDLVPVGADQKQHIEIARDIAGAFNALYGEVLKQPDGHISESVGTVIGLDGRKMSKSYGNVISLFESPEETSKKIMKIPTDSLDPAAPKTKDSILYKLMAMFGMPVDKYLAGGVGYGDAKKALAEAVNAYLAEPRLAYADISRADIDEALAKGAVRARARASAVLKRVKGAIGL